jgi:adenine-specific DNA-methyltransferase
MRTLAQIEQERQQIQQYLDSLKTLQERNRTGQFATPHSLALDIAQRLKTLRSAESNPIQFIEPSIGTGALYSAMCATFGVECITEAMGVEIDRDIAAAAQQLWKSQNLKVIQEDFTIQAPVARYNVLVANPPYVRHHHLTPAQKYALQSAVHAQTGYKVSGLAGLYCYFMLLSHCWLTENALVAWLVPSEFMDVNYGNVLRRYLTERVTLLHIHRTQPTDLQFSDALVSSAIVIYRAALPPNDHQVQFSLGGGVNAPKQQQEIPLEQLQQAQKWTHFPGKQKRAAATTKFLGDLFEIKRGIATGANEFFILSREEAARHRLPDRFLRPILPSPRYLLDQVIEADAEGYPRLSKQLLLVDCNLPMEQIQAEYPMLARYLASGEEQKLHQRYLATKRTPWYRQEQRSPAQFLCTYMGRTPLRFFWNQSQSLASNVYLLLYPRIDLKQKLQINPGLYSEIFTWLQNIEQTRIEDEGRVYGGALHKIEPRELERVPIEAAFA